MSTRRSEGSRFREARVASADAKRRNQRLSEKVRERQDKNHENNRWFQLHREVEDWVERARNSSGFEVMVRQNPDGTTYYDFATNPEVEDARRDAARRYMLRRLPVKMEWHIVKSAEPEDGDRFASVGCAMCKLPGLTGDVYLTLPIYDYATDLHHDLYFHSTCWRTTTEGLPDTDSGNVVTDQAMKDMAELREKLVRA